MPGGADGSIIIDTQLDNSGFKRGSAQLQSAVQSLTNTVNSMGRNMNSAASSVNPALRQIGQSSADAQRSVEGITQAAQELSAAMGESMTEGAFDKNVTAAGRAVDRLKGQLERLSNAERIGLDTATRQTRFQINVDKAAQSVDALKARMQELGDTRVAAPDYTYFQQQLAKLEQQFNKLDDRKAMLTDLGVRESSAQMQRLDYQIRTITDQMNDLKATMQGMEANGTAFTRGIDSAQYQQMAAQLQTAMQEMERFQRVAEQFDTISPEAGEATQALKTLDGELRQKPKDASLASRALRALGNTLKFTASAALQTTKTIGRMSFKAASAGVRKLATSLRRASSDMDRTTLTSQGLVKALTSVKRLLISRVKQKMITAIIQGVGDALVSLRSYSSEFDAAMSSMQSAMKGLSGNIAVAFSGLVNAIAPAITTIINLISSAISYITAFFAMLSGKSSITVAKKGMDGFASSTKKAGGAARELNNQVFKFDELNKEDKSSGGGGGGGGGAGGTEFEEVSIADLLPTDVADFFNRIKDAIRNGDWEGVGAVVAEGLNQIIYAMDSWITRITPIATTWANRLARILNGAVDKLDWSALGKTVGNGINLITDTLMTFFDTFDFVALGKGFASGINGLFDEVNWERLGATLAAKWQSLIATINGFVTNVDWSAMGASISRAISGWFNAINWNQLAVTVSTGINGVTRALHTAITGTDWLGMATTLATNVNTIVAGIDWAALGTLIGDSCEEALNFLAVGIASVDWAAIGSGLASSVNSVFSAIDWETAAANVSSAVISVIDGISTAIAQINWQQIGNDVATFVGSIDWSGLVAALVRGIGAALAGLAQLIWGIIESAWKSVVSWWDKQMEASGGDVIGALLSGITDALKGIGSWLVDNVAKPFVDGLGSAIGVDDLWSVGGDWIGGVLQGITKGLTNVGTWLRTNVFDLLVNGFKTLFGISSPSTVMETNGGFISEGLLNGIKAPFAKISDWVKTNLVDPFVNAFKKLFGINSPSTVMEEQGGYVTEGLSAGFSGGLQAVLDVVGSVFGAIWNAIKNIFGLGKGESKEAKEAKTAGEDIMSGLASGVTGKEETVKTSVRNASATALNTLRTELGVTNGASTKTKPIGNNLVAGINDGINEKATESNFKNAANKIKSAAESALKSAIGAGWGGSASKFKDIGKYIAQGVADGIKNNESTITAAARNAAQAAYDAAKRKLGIHSPSKVFAELGRYTMEGFAVGVHDEEDSALHAMDGIVDAIANPDLGKATFEVEGTALVSGMNSVTEKLGKIASVFDAIASALTAMGGFHVPAVAAGTVAPYRTRVAAEGATTADSAALRAFTTNFDETMSDQSDLLKELIDVVRRLRLIVDGDSLTRTITALQRTQERNYGGA